MPLPANVVTTALGVTFLMRWFELSATYAFPLVGSNARPKGYQNAADVPVPSVQVRAPLPANVVTMPPGVMRRSLLLFLSTTKRFPLLSIAIPWGLFRLTPVPLPSVYAAVPLPARVVTVTYDDTYSPNAGGHRDSSRRRRRTIGSKTRFTGFYPPFLPEATKIPRAG